MSWWLKRGSPSQKEVLPYQHRHSDYNRNPLLHHGWMPPLFHSPRAFIRAWRAKNGEAGAINITVKAMWPSHLTHHLTCDGVSSSTLAFKLLCHMSWITYQTTFYPVSSLAPLRAPCSTRLLLFSKRCLAFVSCKEIFRFELCRCPRLGRSIKPFLPVN